MVIDLSTRMPSSYGTLVRLRALPFIGSADAQGLVGEGVPGNAAAQQVAADYGERDARGRAPFSAQPRPEFLHRSRRRYAPPA